MDGIIAYALAKKAIGTSMGDIATNLSYKGSVDSIEDLPSSPSSGDMYGVGADGLYVWNGTAWGAIGRKGPQGPQGADGEDGHSPYIGMNGNWWTWDDESGAYVDTEVPASGSGIDNVFWATYNVTSFSDVSQAHDDGKIVCVKYNDDVFTLVHVEVMSSVGAAVFVCPLGDGAGKIVLSFNAGDETWGTPTSFVAQSQINDITTIRSGAALGATAVQPSALETALATKQDIAPTITISYTQVVSEDPMIIQLTDAQAEIMDDPDVIAVNFDTTGIGMGIVTMSKAVGDDDPLSYCGSAILPYYGSTSETIYSIHSITVYAYAYSPGDKRVMLSISDVDDFDDPFAHVSDIPTALSELEDDATHRLVSDTEKDAWGGKQDAGKLTIDGTTYNLRTSTTDAGQAGYITFVTED